MEDADNMHDREDWEWSPPCTLKLDYWKRSPQVQAAKDEHIKNLDDSTLSREEQILSTTLRDCDICLEENLFPYDTPTGIEHFTLWSIQELSHHEICSFMEEWCEAHRPEVVEWNYEENSHRSIDIPHVHCFIRTQTYFSRASPTSVAAEDVPTTPAPKRRHAEPHQEERPYKYSKRQSPSTVDSSSEDSESEIEVASGSFSRPEVAISHHSKYGETDSAHAQQSVCRYLDCYDAPRHVSPSCTIHIPSNMLLVGVTPAMEEGQKKVKESLVDDKPHLFSRKSEGGESSNGWGNHGLLHMRASNP